MQGATTAGTEFSQTVTGALAHNQLKPVTETGLPTSKSTTVDSGSSVPITVKVTNTTNHVGFFELQPSGNDISGGNTATPEELAPGTTGTLKATLSPTAAAGTAVKGTLSVIDSTDFAASSPPSGSRCSPTSTISPTPTRSGASSSGSTDNNGNGRASSQARAVAVPGDYSISTIRALTSSPTGLFSVFWAPARSARVTRIATIVTIRAMSMIPADTSNPRANPTDNAWS